jgi:hypothetical protein
VVTARTDHPIAAYLAADPFVLSPKHRRIIAELLDALDEARSDIDAVALELKLEQQVTVSLSESLAWLRAGDTRIHDPGIGL